MARHCKLGSNHHLCREDQGPETGEPERKQRKDDYKVEGVGMSKGLVVL